MSSVNEREFFNWHSSATRNLVLDNELPTAINDFSTGNRVMRVLLLILCGTIACSGCASLTKDEAWKMPNLFSKKEKEPEPYPTPVKMATTWAPDTLSSPGKTTTRGFGGRLFFYNEKSQAVPVDGELLVVGYVDTGVAGAPPITRRYAFTSEQLTSHFAQSDLGASYSIWIPWDADGGMQHTISLVP
ncbi:MAG: hypothetical protein KDJ29_21530, partial [Hyphomicrobiales bacterium]|nr:hypothetical protein [Hyphomicrobiales bacterium]